MYFLLFSVATPSCFHQSSKFMFMPTSLQNVHTIILQSLHFCSLSPPSAFSTDVSWFATVVAVSGPSTRSLNHHLHYCTYLTFLDYQTIPACGLVKIYPLGRTFLSYLQISRLDVLSDSEDTCTETALSLSDFYHLIHRLSLQLFKTLYYNSFQDV